MQTQSQVQQGSESWSSPTSRSPRSSPHRSPRRGPLSADRAERLVDRLAYEYEEKEIRRRRAAAAALRDSKTGQRLFRPRIPRSPTRPGHAHSNGHSSSDGINGERAWQSPEQRHAAKVLELQRKEEARKERIRLLRAHQERVEAETLAVMKTTSLPQSDQIVREANDR